MAQRFGEMLVSRRRQMGYSIQQVSNIIKIRPQIIEHFEKEDFASTPPRGYAQGIIVSYAGLLGLDPNRVVDAYFDALDAYERRAAGAPVGRFQDAASDANPRSAQMPGRYSVLDPERPSSRYVRRPPQAGYVPESASAHEPMATSRLRTVSMADSRRRMPRDGAEQAYRGRAQGSRGTRQGADFVGAPSSQRRGSAAPSNGGARRPQSYQERSGAGYGRTGSRPTGATGSSGGGRPPRSGASSRGGQQPFGMDPKVIMMGVFVLLLAIVVLLSVLLMRGCAPEQKDTGSTSAPSVQKVDTSKKDDASDDTTSSDDATSGDASTDGSSADGTDGTDAATTPQQTVVKVKVAEEGVVAWVEVKLDGKSVLAKQVVGPFEQEFTVTSQIEITTDSPSDVDVYKNDKKVRYDTKVSGVAKVSISAPKVETVDLTVDTDGDGVADMTATDARDAGYDVESLTVDTVTVPKAQYQGTSSGTDDASTDNSDA